MFSEYVKMVRRVRDTKSVRVGVTDRDDGEGGLTEQPVSDLSLKNNTKRYRMVVVQKNRVTLT